MKYKIKDVNYYGINHEKIKTTFEGQLTFVGYMSINDRAAAVYHAAKPNREKGHKEYMYLFSAVSMDLNSEIKTQFYVSGMEKDRAEEEAVHQAILCTGCDTVLYSLTGHHFHGCECSNETFVDGGKNYLRFGGMDLGKIVSGKFNVLTQKFTKQRRTSNRTSNPKKKAPSREQKRV